MEGSRLKILLQQKTKRRINMRKITNTLIFTALILVATVFAFAQQDSKIEAGINDKITQIAVNRVSTRLNLSAEQKMQTKRILKNAKIKIQPLIVQLKLNREEVKQLGVDGVYNEQSVTQLADRQSTLVRQIFIEKEKAKAAFFAILTPAQRELAIKFLDELGDGIRERILLTMMQ
jgi:Spy/CpxP family protein refolding chaperone